MENKPLNILIIASWYKSEKFPSSGTFIEEQARTLHKYGHQVTILHPYLKGTFLETLRSRKTEFSIQDDSGITTIRVGVSPSLPKFRTLSYMKLAKQTLRKTERYLQENPPDIIHSHALFMGGIIGLHLSKHLKIPQFHTEHTSGLIFDTNQYSKKDIELLKEVYNHSKKVFFVSNFALKSIRERYNLQDQNLKVVHNVVDDQFFKLTPIGSDIPLKFLLIGNFIPVKNHDLLLEAWKIFHSMHPSSTLTLAGEGALENELKKKSADIGIKDSIVWLKRQNRQEIKKLIDEHHVILSTSKLETFGLSIAEALASGKPVVVTDSGGIRDIVAPSNGIITNCSAEDFAKGLDEMNVNFGRYNSVEIQNEIKSKFSENIICEQLISEYRSK